MISTRKFIRIGLIENILKANLNVLVKGRGSCQSMIFKLVNLFKEE